MKWLLNGVRICQARMRTMKGQIYTMTLLLSNAFSSTKQKATVEMERLPCELIQQILVYINEPLDLIRISSICRHWRSSILNDEYFVNQWFFRSLKNARNSFDWSSAYSCRENWPETPMACIDESLFPVNLRSHEWCILPWSLPYSLSCKQDSSDFHCHPISLARSYHCLSFWLFLPRRCHFTIYITNFDMPGVSIRLSGDEKYSYDKEKRMSISDRWIHVVVSKVDLQSDYQLCLDGQYLSKVSPGMSPIRSRQSFDAWESIVLYRRHNQHACGTSSKVRIADFIAMKRCLTLVEIRAICQQQISIQRVKVGTYIKNNEQHHSISEKNSNSLSWKFISSFVFLPLMSIIAYIFLKYLNHT